MATVAVHSLTFTYPKRTRPVLDDLTVTFPSGKFSLLTGVSGGGKSTLLKLIAGLTPLPTAGNITFNDQPLAQIAPTQRAATVAMLFQEPSTQFTMDTVTNELRFALENQCVDPAEIPAKVHAALAFIGITDLQDRQLMQLSGGEQQKVALAIIVAMDSDVILLDEPFASIDPPTRLALLGKLMALCTERGKTIILADHDLSNYDQWVDHLAVLDAGKLTLLSPAETQARFAAFTPDKLKLTRVTLPTDQPVVMKGTQLALGHSDRQLVAPQDLTLFAHQATLITGPNGSGKSTLFRALVRLGKYQGLLTYDGNDIQKLPRKQYARSVGLMFQTASSQFLNVTVEEELALSRKFGNQDYFTPERVQGLLTQLNLADHTDQIIYSLSSGQQKKLQLLCMLMMAPAVLLLDEPLKGLDFASIQAVMHILTTAQHDLQLTLIMISHQLSGLDDLITLHLTLADHHLTYKGAQP
ncbi:ABC transporter ATP-binding protein [Levilactobacillus cerevisiae]|uniref:ABC transporter ATP-binding protein n=1 Tax=Levilactobacillus cerevisiae TaxID=1704076 RepID=UPI000F790EDE|nr:ABC transporter ATP-binding protein [Levilactobacillus cerevisiae]